MAYQGRVGVAGNYDGKPFVGFVLASRSEPDRKLAVDKEKNRVWVAPGKDVTAKLEEGDFTAVDNLYACLIGFYDKGNKPTAVSFNGRMGNCVERMMRAGEPARLAMAQILPVFVPQENDPRIGVVAHFYGESGQPLFCWGVYDRADESSTYLSVEETQIGANKALYVPLTSCRDFGKLDLDIGSSLDELSQQLFEKILGAPPEFGCGAAVCMIDGNGFMFGVYNLRKE